MSAYPLQRIDRPSESNTPITLDANAGTCDISTAEYAKTRKADSYSKISGIHLVVKKSSDTIEDNLHRSIDLSHHHSRGKVGFPFAVSSDHPFRVRDRLKRMHRVSPMTYLHKTHEVVSRRKSVRGINH